MENNAFIRKAKLEDMKAVETAHRTSIRELCSKDYSPEQISKWSDVRYTKERWNQLVNQGYYLVVEHEGAIEGFCVAAQHENGEAFIERFHLHSSLLSNDASNVAFFLKVRKNTHTQ